VRSSYVHARTVATLAALASLLAAPAGADAAGSWGCRASGGWVSAGGQFTEPLVAGGDGACANARVDTPRPAAITFTNGVAATISGRPGATTDTQTPVAEATADSVVIENADRSLRVVVRGLEARAEGACSSSRVPGLKTSSAVREVTVNGRSIPADREFSEPGLGVNGAPLFGRLRISFAEVASEGDADAGAQRVLRRAVRVVVTDSGGAVVFEAVAGEVAAGREGRVCEPPPVCPEGQKLDPQANQCVNVDVTVPAPPPPPPGSPPLPDPPALPAPPVTNPPRPPVSCASASARPGTASAARLRSAIVCLINAERAKRRLRRLRVSRELELAARRHARDMVVRRYFAHTSPSGSGVLDRIMRTRYLRRYGRWRLGEVLGWGWGAQGTPAAIVAGWLRSSPHRRQLLGRYLEIGVGVQRAAPRRMARAATTYVVDFGAFSS